MFVICKSFVFMHKDRIVVLFVNVSVYVERCVHPLSKKLFDSLIVRFELPNSNFCIMFHIR